MAKNKHSNRPGRPVTREEAMAIFARFERQNAVTLEDKGLISRLKQSPGVSIPFLAERFKQGNLIQQRLASTVLAIIGGEEVKKALKEIAKDAGNTDRARNVALSTLEEMGVKADSEIVFDGGNLQNITMETFDELLKLIADETQLDAAIKDLEELPADGRIKMIQFLGHSSEPRMQRILLPLLFARDTKTVIAAIDALEILERPEAVPALTTLSKVSPRPEIRNRARKVYSKLAVQAVSPGAPAQPQTIQPVQQLPLFKALVTTIDGDGAQSIIVGRQRPDGRLKIISILFNDHQGIKDCFGEDMVPKREWNMVLSELQAGMSWVDIGLPRCRAILREAMAINEREHRRLPMELEIWGTLLQDGPEAARPLKDTNEGEINIPTELVLEPKLLRRTGELLKLREFQSWGFEPGQIQTSDIVSFEAVSRSRQNKAEKQADLGLILGSILQRLANPKLLARFENRLRRQAWLLQQLGRAEDSRLALAAASALNKESGVPPEKEYFLAEMVVKSVHNISKFLKIQYLDTSEEDD